MTSIQLAAGLIVAAARAGVRRRNLLSGLALVTTLVLATGYLAQGALARKSPLHRTISVRVHLAETGGLISDQDVTLRGQPIGRIRSVTFDDTGVVAVADIDAAARIPADSRVRVAALSAAGEQYLDIQPNGPSNRILTDGATIGAAQTEIPVSLAQLLGDADGALAQLDPQKLSAIIDELRVSERAPTKLADILDGGTFLISTLSEVLPQTVSLIRNSRVVFGTVAETSAGLRSTAGNLHSILQGISHMDNGFRTLVDRGPQSLHAVDDIFADNSDTMVQLLGNMTTVAPLLYLRTPALQALFPNTRGSVLDSVDSIIHDGGIWGIGDVYPRYSCDYNLPRRPPSTPDFPEPYRYTYCANNDPAALVRGARNAPRPPGDDTAGPPSGYDPLQKTDPTPTGKFSIPTTYGGPQLPATPPQ